MMWSEINRMCNCEKKKLEDYMKEKLQYNTGEYIDFYEFFNDLEIEERIKIIDYLLPEEYEILVRNNCLIKVYDIMADEFISDGLDDFIEREVSNYLDLD